MDNIVDIPTDAYRHHIEFQICMMTRSIRRASGDEKEVLRIRLSSLKEVLRTLPDSETITLRCKEISLAGHDEMP